MKQAGLRSAIVVASLLCAVSAQAVPAVYHGLPGAERIVPQSASPAIVGSNVGDGSQSREEREKPYETEMGDGVIQNLKAHPPAGVRLGGESVTWDSSMPEVGASLAPSLGTNFAGMTQLGWIPYDAAMAVGPNDVLLMTNSQWAIYDKSTGAQKFLTQFDPWFGNVAGGGFDPKCFYDAAAARWVIMVVESSNPKALIDISVSQTSDPMGAWWKYSFDVTKDGNVATKNWMDFPHMGFDNNALYVGGDQYSFAGRFKYVKLRVFSKAQMYSGATATYTDFIKFTNADGTAAFAPSPARSVSATASCYMINTRSGSGSNVTLWRIDGAPSATTLTRQATVSCGAYSPPPDAPQLGTTTKIATGDCRTQDCVWQSGTVYTGWSESVSSNGAARYFTINTATGVKIKDLSLAGAGLSYFYPAVAPDASGNGFMVVSRSSASEYASMWHTGLRTTETTLEATALLKAGVSTNTSGRWGDYNAAHADPSNGANVWLCAGWANSGNAWAEWAAQDFFGPAPVKGATSFAPGSIRAVTMTPSGPSHPVVRFALPVSGEASVRLFNATGQLVRTLAVPLAIAGDNTVVWDGRDMSGSPARAGLYWARVEAGSVVRNTRVLLIR